MNRVLVIQLRQLGDILLTTPCLAAIKRTFPDCEVHMLAHPMGKHILEGNPHLHKLHLYPEGQSLGELRLMHRLRRLGFDCVFDFMGNPRSGLYALATGAKQRWGFYSRRRFCYTHTLPRPGSSEYIVAQKFKLLQAAGVRDFDIQTHLPVSQEEHGFAQKALVQLSRQSQEQGPWVVISPTHRREQRKWPAAYYCQLADQLVARWQARVVWIWGPGERQEVESLQKACSRPTFLAPKTSFRQVAALIGASQLFIGNSNGPSHLAVAMGTPSFQFHGPTDLRSWCPRNEIHRGIQATQGLNNLGVETVLGELDNFSSVWRQSIPKSGTVGTLSQSPAEQLLEGNHDSSI